MFQSAKEELERLGSVIITTNVRLEELAIDQLYLQSKEVKAKK